jgi:3-oxoacyl-[acyl-carrier-protein] synthase III
MEANMATAKKTTKTTKTTKKTTAKKSAPKTAKKVEVKSASVLRKGTLAYLGLYGFAAERAAMRAEQVKALYANATDGLFDDLVARGEKVEKLAVGTAKTAQKRAVETFETTTDKVKSAVPFGANDRVEELEAEIKLLTKKITALSKKKTAKKVGINKELMATDKTAA